MHTVLAGLGGQTQQPAKVVLLGPQASHADSALSRFYSPFSYFSWIAGMLRAYDFPDAAAAVAAVAGCDTLILGPVDALLAPLTVEASNSAYAFAVRVTAAAAAGKFAVVPGNFSSLGGPTTRTFQHVAAFIEK